MCVVVAAVAGRCPVSVTVGTGGWRSTTATAGRVSGRGQAWLTGRCITENAGGCNVRGGHKFRSAESVTAAETRWMPRSRHAWCHVAQSRACVSNFRTLGV